MLKSYMEVYNIVCVKMKIGYFYYSSSFKQTVLTFGTHLALILVGSKWQGLGLKGCLLNSINDDIRSTANFPLCTLYAMHCKFEYQQKYQTKKNT